MFVVTGPKKCVLFAAFTLKIKILTGLKFKQLKSGNETREMCLSKGKHH